MAVLTELLAARAKPSEGDAGSDLVGELLGELVRSPGPAVVQLVAISVALLTRAGELEGRDPIEVLREAWVDR